MGDEWSIYYKVYEAPQFDIKREDGRRMLINGHHLGQKEGRLDSQPCGGRK